MTEDYQERWRRKGVQRFGKKFLKYFEMEFIELENVTLPCEAAPFLTLNRHKKPLPIWNVFGSESDWTHEDRSRLAAYRVIGSDGAGDPICLDIESRNVWLLDHEVRFQSRRFMNSGLREFAECLLAYFGETDATRFIAAAEEIDAEALQPGSFWSIEAESIGRDS
jgi:hypothetical protein